MVEKKVGFKVNSEIKCDTERETQKSLDKNQAFPSTSYKNHTFKIGSMGEKSHKVRKQ